jgi:hypothetical protein
MTGQCYIMRIIIIYCFYIILSQHNIPLKNMDTAKVVKQDMETAEIKFLKKVFGYTLKNKIRRTVIRKELNTFS